MGDKENKSKSDSEDEFSFKKELEDDDLEADLFDENGELEYDTMDDLNDADAPIGDYDADDDIDSDFDDDE